MSHNNFVSARGGKGCSVVSRCRCAGITGQRFTNGFLWEEGEGFMYYIHTKLKLLNTPLF